MLYCFLVEKYHFIQILKIRDQTKQETSDNMILIDGNILESLNKSSIGRQLMSKIWLGFRNTRWRIVVIGA